MKSFYFLVFLLFVVIFLAAKTNEQRKKRDSLMANGFSIAIVDMSGRVALLDKGSSKIILISGDKK